MGASTISVARADRRFQPHQAIALVMDATRRFLGDTSGASAAEYALILGLIAAVIVGALGTLVNAVANGIMSPVNGFTTAS
jgi:Flp pilus assembly pilin Flp